MSASSISSRPSGVEDSVAAITKAVALVSSLGGEVVLCPAGTYRLSAIGGNGHIELVNVENVTFSCYGARFISDCQNTARSAFPLERVPEHHHRRVGRFWNGRPRKGSTTTTQGVTFITVRSDCQWWWQCRHPEYPGDEYICIIVCFGWAENIYRVRGITIDNCLAVDGYYGLNFQNNGDLLSVP